MNLRALSFISLLSIFFITNIYTKDETIHENSHEKESMSIDLDKIKKELLEEIKKELQKDQKKEDTKKLGSSDKIQFKGENLLVDLGGKAVMEDFFSKNMTTLNSKYDTDHLFFVRTTADYFMSFAWGDYQDPRIMFYDAIRFRFRWGAPTDAKNVDSKVAIGDVLQPVRGTATTRHLLWMREVWLKLKLGDSDLNHYFQIGLVPYQVGRGISLGQAYEALGFLGFVPGASIDQFAPSVLLSMNPIKNRLIVDGYVALTENNQLTIDQNTEIIRKNDLDSDCKERGVGRQSFIAAVRADVIVFEKDKKKINVEPYFVYQHAPDQDLEFTNDVDTDLTTAGLAIEGVYKRFNWGMEGAVNFGETNIRGWDRNTIILKSGDVLNPNLANIAEFYTKIDQVAVDQFGQVVATGKSPATGTVQKIVNASPKGASENGKKIGEYQLVGTDLVIDVSLYNSIDRFRPTQRKYLKGYFFVGDASYDIIPSDLVMSLGVGYASGQIDPQLDTNKMTNDQLMNQEFTGFIPLQSVYSGKRLRHLVLFNQGIPRFAVRNPLADLTGVNTTGLILTDTINEMTNIMFFGGRIDWKIPQLKKYKFTFSQNVIPYWAPETASFVVSHPEDASILLQESSNYLGTELTTEWSAMFYDKLKFSGYFGVLIPGQHYKDMCGTPINKGRFQSGSDMAYVGNIQLSYFF